MLQRYQDQFAGTGMEQQTSASLVPPLSYLPMTANDTDTVCNLPPTKGGEGKEGWDVLLKVDVDAQDTNTTSPNSNSTNPNRNYTVDNDDNGAFVSKGKILCGIYTYGKMHSRMVGVTETWGWRCDGFLAASTATIDDPNEPGFPATDLPHEGKEEYDNMWQKTRSILSYMYDHYFDDYDYFYLSGDDTHLIVENLRRYLYETEQAHDAATTPLYMGMKVKAGKVVFNGGGAGYVLNRVALQRLVVDAFPTCLVHARQSSEDRFVGRCFDKISQIRPLDTVDALGRQRFHGMDSSFIGSFQGNVGYFNKVYRDWGNRYGWKTGIDLVSDQSVSFHLLRGATIMRRHHAILYQSCPADTVLAKAVQEARTKRTRPSSVVSTSNSSTIAI
jgi:glycoprotein-N-acetylgalactosamine 3-beta-galactosyltransferase